MSDFFFSARIEQPLEAAIATLRDALMKQHLGIVSDVDVAAIVSNKLGEDMPPYRILGACNPKMAKGMIESLPQAGALLPCTIVAREVDGATVFDFMDPVKVLGIAGNAVMDEVAAEARNKLRAAIAELG